MTLPKGGNDPKQLTLSFFILWMRCLNSLHMKLTVMQNYVKKIPEKPRGKLDSVSVSEIKTYIVLCIAMGIIKLPSLHDY